MKIAVVTYDLWPGRERLMPWKTVIEVTRRMRAHGHDARVVSISAGADHSYVSHDSGLPLCCYPTVSDLKTSFSTDEEETFNPALVYWPVTWRSGLKGNSVWHPWTCATVAYHGGCCYNAGHVRAAMRHMPFRSLRTLMVETYVPKHILVRKLRKLGVIGVLCMTDLTRRMFAQAGWPKEKAIAIPPGLPPDDSGTTDMPSNGCLENIHSGLPYVLFLGNPLPIRGIYVLLSASRKVFANNKNSRIVCLLRPDPGKEMTSAREGILRKVKELGVEERFICITRKLTTNEIRQSIKNARAVTMPFLYIPSEIPLGILEAMQMGTPVITSESGGTSEYLGDCGWIVPPGNVDALANAVLSALQDAETRQRKADACREKMALHPTWETVGDAWLEFGLSALKGLPV